MTRLTRALLLAAPLVGLVELGAELWLGARAPTEATWSALPSELEQIASPGTPVVVSPRWAEPHVRAALGDAWFPLETVAHSGLETFPRVVEVVLGGARSVELEGFREVDRRAAGELTVRLLHNPSPARVLFDFVDALTPERVVVFGTEPSRPCRFQPRARVLTGGLSGHPTLPRRRFDCGEGGWSDVGVTAIADERFLPRRCIFAHPPARGARVLRYDDVPLGRELVVDLGMYWVVERRRAGAPIRIEVRVDDELVGEVVHRDGEGWARTTLPLGAHATKSRASVEFRISAEDPAYRHACFRADVR